MPKFLVRANYVGAGVKGLIAEGGTKRRDAVRASLESVGGTLECFYYAFGDTDVFGIGDFPDEATATAWSLMVNSSGAVTLNLVPLLTAETLDAAAAKTATYRAPGA
ncbi:MAG: GYD domain-containing protein [Acidimicrobiales bacterium]